MSFSVTAPEHGLEYSSRGVAGFFAQPSRVMSVRHHRLLWQIVRFNRLAPAVLDRDDYHGVTLSEYLRLHQFDGQFAEHYLLPMTSAIWSAPASQISRFPVATIVRFMHNHGMLSVGRHPAWYVVKGGSATYIPKLAAPLGANIHTGVQLSSITRDASAVTLTFADRPAMTFDHVVLACHGDQVLPLLVDPSSRERDVFSRFSTTTNETWLHTDRSLLPSRNRAWASWNYRLGDQHAPPCVTYHLNRLQGIDSGVDYCVTLNPVQAPASASVIMRKTDRHPRLDLAAITAQRRWIEVSGVQRTHYCGAYWRYGFHEDGLWSAIRVAAALGVEW
jgi:predicted NAD/FAD-binding protein